MEQSIGPETFSRTDNLPFCERGIDFEFYVHKENSEIKKIPRSKMVEVFPGATAWHNLRAVKENFPLLLFPKDSKEGRIVFTVQIKRRPNMYSEIRPFVLCVQVGDSLPGIKLNRVFTKRKYDTDRCGRRYLYIEERYVGSITLPVLYKSLQEFFEQRKRTVKWHDIGRLDFHLYMKLPKNDSILADNKIWAYHLDTFIPKMERILVGRRA